METGNIVGIDFGNEHILISYFHDGMKEPDTVSLINGSQMFKIPQCICKRPENGAWVFGTEAVKTAHEACIACADRLLMRALNNETVMVADEVYDAKEVLTVFVKKILGYALPLAGFRNPDKIVVTLERMMPETMQVLTEVLEKIGFKKDSLLFLDYAESFYYYALSQPRELSNHDVMMYYHREGELRVTCLAHKRRAIPQEMCISEENFAVSDTDRDNSFYEVLIQSLEGHLTSSVYLIGDWFDGDWMHKSLSYLGKGRRVFAGKNLYCKGACYAGFVKLHSNQWRYRYQGADEIAINVSIKITEKGKTRLLPILTAGSKWYETQGFCEVILSGSPTIDLWIQRPESREADIRTLELSDFPLRKERTTRIRLEILPKSKDEVVVSVKDLGFGEIYPGTSKTWDYTMELSRGE